MTDCSVCVSSYAVEISSMISCGADAETIAASTGLDVNAVEEHMAVCCVTPVQDDSPDSLEKSDQRLRALAAKIAAAGVSSGLAGDAKSLLAALAIELRVETALRERLEKQEEKSVGVAPGEFSEDESSRFISFVDSILEDTTRRKGVSPEARWLGMQVQIGKRPDGNKVLDLVQRLLDNPALLADVQVLAQGPEELPTSKSILIAGVTN
jgi:hypothetical protein